MRLAPRSPYAAAKAAGELLVRSYVVTHGVDAVVTRGSNTYGPYHHPEKLIPLFVTNAIDDRPLPLYGDGLQRRDWLYVVRPRGGDRLRAAPRGDRRDLQRARRVRDGRTARSSGSCSSASASRGRSSATSRTGPGHDRRYAMDGTRLAALGWRPQTAFDDGPRRDRRLVRRQRGLVAGRPLGRLGRLLRAPVRARASPPSTGRLMRSPSPARPGGSGRRLVTRARRCAVHRPRRAARLGPARASTSMRPTASATALDRDRPEVVVHAAAWTDVDGCARDPDRALARNGTATGVLASGLRARGIDLVVVSTNEVFDGRRTDGIGYGPDDRARAGQPVRRLEARRGARRDRRVRRCRSRARASASSGRPGSSARASRDFPRKILAAADRAAAAGEPLRVVADEWGTPDLRRRRRRRDRGAAWPRTRTPASTTSSTG